MDQSETNVARRAPLTLEVSFRRNYARQGTPGLLKNISVSGAFLDCPDKALRAKDKLQLDVIVSGRKRSLAATVVWANSAGAGIKFHPGSQRDTQIVDDLIYFVENKRTSSRDVLEDIFKKVA